jgi:hypothetical protein
MKIGDVMYLKNDSAPLVIKTIGDDDTVEVYGHEANGRIEVQKYPSACLTDSRPK